MSYSSQDGRRRSRNDQRSRRRSGSRQRTRSNRPAPQGSDSRSRRGTLTRPDTGYTLHSHRVRREPGRGALAILMRPRVLLFVLILVLVVVVLVVGVTSCVKRNNEQATQAVEEVKPKNEQDDRVAAGVSASMTSKFTEALDTADLLASIAENADKYDDDRLLTLALNEPSSIPFVAAYPTSDKSSRPYDDDIKRGEVPCLYNWDERWGAVTYGNGPLAVTGSGPTTLAMAYMGLTGKSDFSPTEIAQQAGKSNYADGDSGSKGELFSKLATSMGLSTSESTPSSDTLLLSLGENTVFAVELKEDTLTDEAHWALVVNINEDGSVTVFDPTSTMVSSRPWDMSTISNASTTFFAISPSEKTLSDLDAESTTNSTGNGTNNGTSSSDASSKKDTSTSTSSSSSATGADDTSDSSNAYTTEYTYDETSEY